MVGPGDRAKMGKGLSAEDKRKTVLQLLRSSKRPYTLKDLEKLAAKAGVVQNTVKDVVQGLEQDGLVDMDKIGSTNWFWSFPSKDAAARRTKLRQTQERVTALEAEIAQLKERRAELERDRPQTEERRRALAELSALQAQRKDLEARLELARANDPETVRKMQRAVEEAKRAAERWTDNTFALMDWLKKSYGMPKQDILRQLGVTDDFDVPVYAAVPKRG